MDSKKITVTVPLDTPGARQSAAIAFGYPDWQALADATEGAGGPQRELDPIVKAAGATFRYLAEWFGTDEQRAELYKIAVAVEAFYEQDACCPVCEEVTCDEGCPLEPVRTRWDEAGSVP